MEEKMKLYPVRLMIRQLHQAEKNGMKLPHIMKMLKLLLGQGVNYLIDPPGIYSRSNFYQLARILNYHTSAEMIYDVRQTGWFYMAEDTTNGKELLWFASPVYLKEDEIEKAKENPFSGDLFAGTPHDDSAHGAAHEAEGIIVTTTSINTLRRKKINIPPGGTHGSTGLSRAQKEEEVEKFIRAMRTKEEAPMFETLREKLMEQGESEEDARGIIAYLMRHTLKSHFLEQDRFYRTSHSGRKVWLTNLLYGKGAAQRTSIAKRYYHQQKCRQENQDAAKSRENARSNKPISPHEWMSDGRRYYEDLTDGVVQIPAEAAPRPNNQSTWNIYLNEWTE